MANSKRPAPVPVRVRNRGQISNALERQAEEYRKQFPDREVRYVYDPEHKPELSGILGRKAQGYRIVTQAEVGLTGDEAEENKPVRVGDLVLMSIPRAEKEAEEAYRANLSKEQMQRVQRDFYQDQGELGSRSKPGHHSKAPTRPIGTATIEERDFEYDVEQGEE